MSTAFRFDSSTVARRLFRVPLSKQTRGWISFSEGCPRQTIYLAWPNWTYPEREREKRGSETKRLSRCLPRFDRLLRYITRSVQAHDDSNISM